MKLKDLTIRKYTRILQKCRHNDIKCDKCPLGIEGIRCHHLMEYDYWCEDWDREISDRPIDYKKVGVISIKPKHVMNILNGDKTVEIRTTCPKEWKDYLNGKTNKIPEPIDFYIYCTIDKKHLVAPFHFQEGWFYREFNEHTNYANGCTAYMGEVINGKVVAKFTLLAIKKFNSRSFTETATKTVRIDTKTCKSTSSCLSYEEIRDYCKGTIAYAWYIDNLVIFDKPTKINKAGFGNLTINKNYENPPQSWCYAYEEEK